MEGTKKTRKARPRKARKQQSKPRKALGSSPLPPAVEVNTETQPEPLPQSNEPESGGLFGLNALFGGNPKPENRPAAVPGPVAGGSNGSLTSSYEASAPAPGSPVTAEGERLLSSIPDVIAEPGDEPGDVPGTVEPDAGGGDLGAVMFGGEIISAENMADILQLLFGWIADFRKRECYRLNDAKAGTLARPWAPIINGWIARVAPAWLQSLSQSNPGMMAALISTAMVVGPMVSEDLKQTRAERVKVRQFVRPSEAHGTVQAQQPKPPVTAPARGGMIWDAGAEQAA